MLFKQMRKWQDGRFIGQERVAWVKTSEVATHADDTQSKPLLQKGDTQHDLYGKRQTANGKRQTANGKRRAPALAACIQREGRTHCNQRYPRSDQAQLIEFTLHHKLKFGGGDTRFIL